jgi:hypothetical protein
MYTKAELARFRVPPRRENERGTHYHAELTPGGPVRFVLRACVCGRDLSQGDLFGSSPAADLVDPPREVSIAALVQLHLFGKPLSPYDDLVEKARRAGDTPEADAMIETLRGMSRR